MQHSLVDYFRANAATLMVDVLARFDARQWEVCGGP